ncbi:MAG: hypothetical protein H6595_12400 [Flavobacteriales bacterium]|nr:hypothetical protein [Flavobacteriales bacterium]MCB9168262.1 hypothetical protein [Flavobacteriales bacterium]
MRPNFTFSFSMPDRPSLLERTRLWIACLLAAGSIPGLLSAQQGAARIKVEADRTTRPDEVHQVIAMIRGDATSIVGLRVPVEARVLGGVPQKGMDWSLVTWDREKMERSKQLLPKMIYGIGPVCVETIFKFQGKCYLLGSKVLPDQMMAQLIVQEFDPHSLVTKGGRELVQVPLERFGGATRPMPGAAIGFNATLSADSSQLCLSTDPENTSRPGATYVSLVFHKDLQLHWSNVLAFDQEPAGAELLQDLFDSEAVHWFLFRTMATKNPKDTGSPAIGIKLVRMDSSGQKMKDVELPGSAYVQDARMVLRPDGKLLFGGVWAERKMRNDRSKGMFVSSMNTGDLEWGAMKMVEFEKKVIEGHEELQRDMVVEDLLVMADGGLALLTDEHKLRTTQSSNFANKMVTRESYISGDLHILRTNRSGDKTWYTVIPRGLSLDSPHAGEPFALAFGDQLFVMMNDAAGNEELRKHKEPIPVIEKGGEAMVFDFKEDGSGRGKVALDERGQGYFLPGDRWILGPGEIGLLGSRDLGGKETFPVRVFIESGR